VSWIKSRRIDLWPYTHGISIPTPVNYGTNVTVSQQFPIGMRTLAPMVLQTYAPSIRTPVNYGTNISVRQEFPLARMTMPGRFDFYPPSANPPKVPFVNYVQTRQEFPAARMTMPAVFSWRQPSNPPSTISYVNSIITRQSYPTTPLGLMLGWANPENPMVVNYDSRIMGRQEFPLARMTPQPQISGPAISAVAAAVTWNPADKNAGITLSSGDLVATAAGAGFVGVRATVSISSGKKYFEVTMNFPGGGQTSSCVGIANGSWSLSTFVGDTNSCGLVVGTGAILGGGTGPSTDGTFAAGGDVVCVAVNKTADLIWFRVNGGNWNGSATADPATETSGTDTSGISGAIFPASSLFTATDNYTANFGATAYAQTPPTGYGNF